MTLTCRIRIVEDNPDTAEALSRFLSLSGHESICVPDHEAALTPDDDPHIALLDPTYHALNRLCPADQPMR
jgi:DNA-binding response OmpR family regulator